MAFLKRLKIDGIKDAIETGVKTAQEGISNIKVDEVVQGAKDRASTGVAAVGKAIENATKKPSEEQEEASQKEFIGLLWCMAYADGEITADEKVVLEELSSSIDDNYSSYSKELEQEYGAKLVGSGKEFGYQNAVKIEAQKLVESIELSPTDAKLLCWNLLALANSDGLDESEADLIRFIGEKAGVDAAVIEELRNYADAIVEIEKAIDQLKQADRSYGEIEPVISEFAKREQALINAAQSLIADR